MQSGCRRKADCNFSIPVKAEKQSVGQETVCNYLDNMGIPALVISVSKSVTTVRETLSILGPGYVIETIDGLGDEAAIAIQQENPEIWIERGNSCPAC